LNKQKLKIKSVGNLGTVGNSSTTYTSFFNLTFENTNNLASNISSNTFTKYWEFHNLVDVAPDQTDYVYNVTGSTTAKDELHVVVVDEDGRLTGVPGQVLEVYQQLSRATNAKNSDGTTLYYKDVINEVSDYVWAARDRTGAASAAAASVATSGNRTPLSLSMVIGSDGANESTVATSDIVKAYDIFKDAQNVDVGLIIAGKARGTSGTQVANYIIDNVAEVRKDCVVFVSPEKSDVYNVPAAAAQNVVDFRNALRSTSYAVLDSGYKYQYDKYNDVYRYVPLNGDTAGITARSENIRDPWYSPAGFNRGTVKNLVKLAFNPTKTDRDLLYKNGVNPVVTFPGQGTVLYGDKTLLARPSAFDRINVRRLFVVLEKTIANAANSTLFEFNDEFTRLQFLNLIEPFLRDVQGRRGITDFRVVCDETNNTSQVVDTNRFVGDIYIKPARSINFIQLNFVAVRSGVEFSEIVGQF
jgi:phage tail sheath protein FI